MMLHKVLFLSARMLYRTYNKCVRGVFLGVREKEWWGIMEEAMIRVQMNSDQVSLESPAGAVERLCGPDMFRELVPPLRCQNTEEL